FDVHDLRLPECQRKLFDAVKKTGKKVVLLLMTGRPNVIVDEYEKSDAVLQLWYLGHRCGEVVAEILYGAVNPTGKLAVSFPRSNGHLPCYYNYRRTNRGILYGDYGSKDKPGHSYVFDDPNAFLPFGYGIGYVPIEYKTVRAKQTGENTVRLTVTLKNAGDKDTEESVLAFVGCEYCYMVVPYIKQLKAFRRVKLKAGQTRRVTLTLGEEAFTYIDEDMKKKVCKGRYKITVADKEVDIVLK
ncbi:MAG: glycoside hydrolase family 3 C-terminal domain-containing protein, partial [Clostridia bacterium]|nr:glycoside hydrolase family 3 C-terminal domain-containing protein [Clostridia bacterium]